MLTAAAWTLVGASAAAGGAPGSPLHALRQGEALSCRPTLPHFCENLHVQCAGRTEAATFLFGLRAASGPGSVALVAGDKDSQRRYEGARVEWAEDGSYLLLSPRAGSGYVKVREDGKYVLRHYLQGRGVMSLGHCH